MSNAELPLHDCKSESDVEQKFVYPFLTNQAFLAVPERNVLSKRSLGTFSFVDKASLPKNYIPDYIIFFDALPACIVEAKEPRETLDQAMREARLYGQILNQHFPTGVNPICLAIGCNGKELGIGAIDTNEFKRYPLRDIVIGSTTLKEIKDLFSIERLSYSTARARRLLTRDGVRTPASFMNSSLFVERVRQNTLSPYLNQINEMFFKAEDPERIELILEEGYVDTADLREYDNTLQAMLKQIENKSDHRLITTDKKREYALSPEIARYEKKVAEGRMHLVIGARGTGKSLFIARFFHFLFPASLKQNAAWLIIDFNKAPDDLGNIELFLFSQLVDEINNLKIDQYTINGLKSIFSLELSRLKKGALTVISDRAERERAISNELLRLSNDKIAYGKAIARYITGDSARPLIIAFDNVDRRRSEQQLSIFQAAQSFRSVTKAFCLLTLRDTTFESYKKTPPLDTFAQVNNFYIRPPRFSLVLQKRLTLAIEKGLQDVVDIEQISSGGSRIVYSRDQLKKFLSSVYTALFGNENQVGRIVDALAERDVRDALAMFARIMSSGHFDADKVIQIGVGGSVSTPNDQLIKILMRADYKLFNENSGFLNNIFWLPDTVGSKNLFLGSEVIAFFTPRNKQGRDLMAGYWRLEEALADLCSMGFEEHEVRNVVNHFLSMRLLTFDGESTQTATDADLIKISPKGFIHLRSLPAFIEYISSIAIHTQIRDVSVARRIGAAWNRTEKYSDLDFLRKHDVSAVFGEYLIREKARLDSINPIFAERARESEAIVKLINSTVNSTASIATSIRERRLRQNKQPSGKGSI